MTGMLLLPVVFLWIWINSKITQRLCQRFVPKKYHEYALIPVFLLLFPLPVADEIIGGFQFRALCKEGAQLKIDAEAIRGKTVRVVIEPSNKYLSWMAIPIRWSHFSYRDVATDEEYANFDIYNAKGGILINMLGISEKNVPLTMYSGCYPPRYGKLDKQYQFTLIN